MNYPSLLQKWHPPRKTFSPKKSQPASFKSRSLSWDRFLSPLPIQKYPTRRLQARNEPPNRICKWALNKEWQALKSSSLTVVLKRKKKRRMEFHRQEKGGKIREKQWKSQSLRCQFRAFPKSTTKQLLLVTRWVWFQTKLMSWSRQRMMLYLILKHLSGWKVPKDAIVRDLWSVSKIWINFCFYTQKS